MAVLEDSLDLLVAQVSLEHVLETFTTAVIGTWSLGNPELMVFSRAVTCSNTEMWSTQELWPFSYCSE